MWGKKDVGIEGRCELETRCPQKGSPILAVLRDVGWHAGVKDEGKMKDDRKDATHGEHKEAANAWQAAHLKRGLVMALRRGHECGCQFDIKAGKGRGGRSGSKQVQCRVLLPAVGHEGSRCIRGCSDSAQDWWQTLP